MSESKMNKQAFLIGINQYAALPELKYARQDAEAVEQALKQNYSFSDNEVMLMTDAKPGLFKPFNKRVIQMHLENLANQELDLFIFGFWGHGLFRNGERYLCPLDVMNVDVEESGFSFTELQRLLSKIRAKNTCMILDCCQTIHDSRGEAETLTIADQTNMENAARDIVLRRKEQYPEFVSNVAILNSCKEGQRSYEWDKRQHGIFTAHLLDAMNQRYESVAKIIGYISSNVEKTAMELGKIQTPFYKLEGDIPLIKKESTPFVTGDVSSSVSSQPKTESKESHNPIADFLKSERQKKLERLQNEAIAAFKNEEFRKAISKLE
ncbi:MAG: caspase family protein [Thermoguttaceae bacterium]|nr:caspase family protein [Thermoguttaceae bacterium]